MLNSKSDKDILNDIIANIDKLVYTIPNQFIKIKDLESTTLYISKPYADFLHVKPEQVIGIKKSLTNDADSDILINNEDKVIINSRQPLTGIRIHIIDGILKPLLCLKSPIIDPQSNNVIGIFAQVFEHGIINLHQDILKLPGQSNKNKTNIDKLSPLTRREKQVIFFFMAHLSSQEIVDALYQLDGKLITISTIDGVFKDLYIKFKVYNRKALYDKLQAFGFDRLIPQDILSTKAITSTQFESY